MPGNSLSQKTILLPPPKTKYLIFFIIKNSKNPQKEFKLFGSQKTRAVPPILKVVFSAIGS